MPSDFSDADIEALRRSVARRIDTVITEAIQSITAPPETTLGVEHLEYAREILLRNNPYGQNRRRLHMFTIKDDYEEPNWDVEGMRTGVPSRGISEFLIDDPDFTV